MMTELTVYMTPSLKLRGDLFVDTWRSLLCDRRVKWLNGAEEYWQHELGSRHVTKFGQKVKLQCTDYNLPYYI